MIGLLDMNLGTRSVDIVSLFDRLLLLLLLLPFSGKLSKWFMPLSRDFFPSGGRADNDCRCACERAVSRISVRPRSSADVGRDGCSFETGRGGGPGGMGGSGSCL